MEVSDASDDQLQAPQSNCPGRRSGWNQRQVGTVRLKLPLAFAIRLEIRG